MSAAGANAQQFEAKLVGFNETPSTFTPAQGTLKLNLNTKLQSATYTLTYSGLRGTVTQAHIHFAKARVAGGIFVWLCQTATNPAPAAVAASTPTCPQSGTVTGTITPASIIAVAPQGIPAGDFDVLTDALSSGSAYSNVHSTQFPAGEIRGQIHPSEDQQGQQ
jgi:hypothetical protein